MTTQQEEEMLGLIEDDEILMDEINQNQEERLEKLKNLGYLYGLASKHESALREHGVLE